MNIGKDSSLAIWPHITDTFCSDTGPVRFNTYLLYGVYILREGAVDPVLKRGDNRGTWQKHTASSSSANTQANEHPSFHLAYFNCWQTVNIKWRMVLWAVNANVFKYVLVVSLLFMWIIKVYTILKLQCVQNILSWNHSQIALNNESYTDTEKDKCTQS